MSEADKDGDKPQEEVLFVKIVWNKTTDKFECECNVQGRIDLIGMLGFAKRQLLARLDFQQAQKMAQEQHIMESMKLPLRSREPS